MQECSRMATTPLQAILKALIAGIIKHVLEKHLNIKCINSYDCF